MSGTGIVIQGPLASRGKTGRHAGIETRAVPAHDLGSVDCVPLIARTAEAAHAAGVDRVVVAAWDTEDEADLARLPPTVEVLRVPDPWRDGEGWHPMPNSPRQVVATLAGIRALLAGDAPSRVVKVRSDQVVDVGGIVRWLDATDPTGLGVPYLDRREPWMFVDFYLAGRTDVVLDACTAVLGHQLRPLQPSIHDDVTLKLALASAAGPTASLATYFLPPHRRHAAQRDVVAHAVGHLLTPMPRSVWAAVEWRGDPIRADFPYADRIFAEDAATGAVDAAVADVRATFVRGTVGPPALHLLAHPHGALYRRAILHEQPRPLRPPRARLAARRLLGRLRR